MSGATVIPLRPRQRKIVGYRIVTGFINDNMASMETKIANLLNQGYQPYGEMKAAGSSSLAQAMVKYEE
jgi:hypothetical protein